MSKPVVFVPGFPGTDLIQKADGEKIFFSLRRMLAKDAEMIRLLPGPDDPDADDGLVAGEPIERLRFLVFDLAKQAASLYEILGRMGIDPVRFGWDWRRPVWGAETQARLEAEIRDLHRVSGPVTMIVHSTGGLVLRHLVETKPAIVPLLDQVIAFGVPWAGVLKSLRFLDGQDDFVTIDAATAQRIIASSWAAYDLLPPDPATADLTDADGNPLNLVIGEGRRPTSPLVERGWCPDALRDVMTARADGAVDHLGDRTPELRTGGRALKVTNVVGWGEMTVVQATIDGLGGRISHWTTGTEALGGGDGTVPFRSASWLRGPTVTRFHLPVGFHRGAHLHKHSSLWRNPGGRNLLSHLLDGKPLKPFVYAAVDSNEFHQAAGSTVTIRVSALDRSGAPLERVKIQARRLHAGPGRFRHDDLGDGRHRVRVPRARIHEIRDTHGGRLRRVRLRITWDGGSVDRALLVSDRDD